MTSISSAEDPFAPGHLQRGRSSGVLTRIGRGLYVPVAEWKGLRWWEQPALLAHSTGHLAGDGVVLSHQSAALLLGIDVLGPVPAKPQVVVERQDSGLVRATVQAHTTKLWADPIQVGEAWVTPPARTVVDIAATRGFAAGLITADSAIRLGLVSKEELQAEVERHGGRRGIRQARAVIERADGASGAASESLSRARLYQLGARIPILQKRFVIGTDTYYVDFYWEDSDAVGECDGLVKYRDSSGAAAPGVLVAEKYREDALRQRVRAFRRWGWNDAYHVDGLERILRDVGALSGPARALFGLPP